MSQKTVNSPKVYICSSLRPEVTERVDRIIASDKRFSNAFIFRPRGIDVALMMLKKHEYNKTRPYKHGRKM